MIFDFSAVASGKKPKHMPKLEEKEIVAVPAMDLEAIKNGLKAAYDDEIDTLMLASQAHEIIDEASERTAIEMAGQAKIFLKRMDDERKKIIQEPDNFVRGVNKVVKVFRDKISAIETELKKKVGDFQWKKELEHRKREKAAQEAARKLQEQVEKEAKEAGVEAPVIVPAPVEKKETVTRTDTGASAHIRTEWKLTEVLDFSKVPDDYKVLNDKQVNAAIKAGIRNIEGLKIEEVPITVLRA
jgi:hypothetical protein